MNTQRALLKAAMALDEAISLLELEPEALGDPAALKTAYRGASRKHHPDFGGNVEIMKKVNEAYELLTKQHKRTSPGGKSKAEEKAEYAANVARSLKIVKESLSKSFDPAAFTKHFEKVTSQPFTPTVEESVSEDYDGNPHYVRTKAEWRSEDGKTVFSLVLSINLADVARVRMLGGDDDGENLAFNVTMLVEILHDKRKSKFKPRDWASSSKSRTLMDPNDLFPAVKIKKMLGGKEKGRKFSKRDMELGIEKLLGGRLDRQGTQLWAFIPMGEPQPQERSPGAISREDEDRFVFPMYRSVMTFRGVSSADWHGMGIQGPYVPKKGREKFSGEGWRAAMESEELLDALAAAQKKAKGVADGKRLAGLIDDAFEAANAAYKANHPES